MHDYANNLDKIFSKDSDSQMQGLAFFAAFDETHLSKKVIVRLIQLSESSKKYVADVANSIILQNLDKGYVEPVAEAVNQRLNGDNQKVSIYHLQWAVKLKTSKAHKSLENYLENCTEPKHISWLVKHLPHSYPHAQLIPLLTSFLTHSDERVVANAIEGLSHLNDSSTISTFIHMLSHLSSRVRSVAAAAIARANPEIARSTIFEMLQKANDIKSIKSACFAIKHLDDKNYLELLLPLLQNEKTSNEAGKALALLAYEKIKPILEKVNKKAKKKISDELIEILNQ